MSDRLPWFRCFPSALLGAMAGLEADESLVYVTLLLRIYETGGPVHENGRTLARRTGLTERRASAALATLINHGKVVNLGDGMLDSASTHEEIKWQTERRAEQSSAGKASAAKRQKTASTEKNDAFVLADDADKAQKDKQNQQNGATRVDPAFNHLDLEEEIEQEEPTVLPETRARESFPPKAFEAFWLKYPNKVGKHAAEASFDRVRKSGKVFWPNLMSGLDRYIATKPPDRSWCNPATWLNQGRYDDEPEPQSTATDLFRNGSAGGGRGGTGLSPVAAAVAKRADLHGFGLGSGQNGHRSDDARGRPARGDDAEIETADWTPARSYQAAHH